MPTSDIQLLAQLLKRAANSGTFPVTHEERQRLEELIEKGYSTEVSRVDGQIAYESQP